MNCFKLYELKVQQKFPSLGVPRGQVQIDGDLRAKFHRDPASENGQGRTGHHLPDEGLGPRRVCLQPHHLRRVLRLPDGGLGGKNTNRGVRHRLRHVGIQPQTVQEHVVDRPQIRLHADSSKDHSIQKIVNA